MARKLRIEYEGAMYHVINRGNYRADVFETDGAKEKTQKGVKPHFSHCRPFPRIEA